MRTAELGRAGIHSAELWCAGIHSAELWCAGIHSAELLCAGIHSAELWCAGIHSALRNTWEKWKVPCVFEHENLVIMKFIIVNNFCKI